MAGPKGVLAGFQRPGSVFVVSFRLPSLSKMIIFPCRHPLFLLRLNSAIFRYFPTWAFGRCIPNRASDLFPNPIAWIVDIWYSSSCPRFGTQFPEARIPRVFRFFRAPFSAKSAEMGNSPEAAIFAIFRQFAHSLHFTSMLWNARWEMYFKDPRSLSSTLPSDWPLFPRWINLA